MMKRTVACLLLSLLLGTTVLTAAARAADTPQLADGLAPILSPLANGTREFSVRAEIEIPDGANKQTITLDLNQIDEAPGIDLLASRTFPAGSRTHALFAIEGFCQDARDRGLAHTAGAGEQKGVMQAIIIQGIDQGLNHMPLSDQFFKTAWTPFTRQDLVTHRVPPIWFIT